MWHGIYYKDFYLLTWTCSFAHHTLLGAHLLMSLIKAQYVVHETIQWLFETNA
jgi:hypothetical protein